MKDAVHKAIIVPPKLPGPSRGREAQKDRHNAALLHLPFTAALKLQRSAGKTKQEAKIREVNELKHKKTSCDRDEHVSLF